MAKNKKEEEKTDNYLQELRKKGRLYGRISIAFLLSGNVMIFVPISSKVILCLVGGMGLVGFISFTIMWIIKAIEISNYKRLDIL